MSIESDEMLNVYTGNVTTDVNGYAEVQLEDWMNALNTDFRYQLTVMDKSFAQAIIWEQIDTKGKFMIKTDLPNIQVSWMVSGVRQDTWANDHRLVVEVDKEEEMKGSKLSETYYDHPAPWETE